MINRYINSVILFFLTVNIIYSNVNDSCLFLNLEKRLQNKKEDTTIYFHEYSKPTIFRNKIQDSLYCENLIVSSGICHQSEYSDKMNLFFKIFAIYKQVDTNTVITLNDKNNEIYYDLFIKKCCDSKEFGDVKFQDSTLQKKILNSILNWYKIFRLYGIDYTRKNQIEPTFDTEYKFIVEEGYFNINEPRDKLFFFKTANNLISDSIKCKRFLNIEFLDSKKYEWQEIIIKVIVIGYLNNFFNTNICIFKNDFKDEKYMIKFKEIAADKFEFLNSLSKTNSIEEINTLFKKYCIESLLNSDIFNN